MNIAQQNNHSLLVLAETLICRYKSYWCDRTQIILESGLEQHSRENSDNVGTVATMSGLFHIIMS